MATITLKNIPKELYSKLKVVAKVNRRSINSEAIICLEKVLLSRRKPVEEILEEARQLREFTTGYVLTPEELEEMINEGRP